jgi:RNA polymerase sigma-70 factor (ECF subfamily)
VSKSSAYRDLSDEHLMEQIGRGERLAFEELYERYFDILQKFARGFLKSDILAEDMVQEVFLQIIHRTKQFDINKRFRTWVLTVLANKCKNHLRNESTRRQIDFQKASESRVDPGKRYDYIGLADQIRLSLDSCSAKQQQLFHLRFEMDLSIRDIAETLQIPEGSVKSGLFYLIKKLRSTLKQSLT